MTPTPPTTNPAPEVGRGDPCARPRIAVFGIGNLLRSDDAFGPRVIQRIEDMGIMPAGVAVADLGTPGLDLASHIAGFDLVVLIDTVMIEGTPGTLVQLKGEELIRPIPHAPQTPRPRMTMHDAGIEDAIALAELCGNPVGEVVLVGVVPANLEQGCRLSMPVEDAIDRAIDEALSIVLTHLSPALAEIVAIVPVPFAPK